MIEHANVCPLGSGAIAGSTLPLDRELVAKTLGFVDENGEARITPNGMDAVADRDIFVEFAAAAYYVLFTCQIGRRYDSLELIRVWLLLHPMPSTTGSSLMPQKKNPDSFELIRGKPDVSSVT